MIRARTIVVLAKMIQENNAEKRDFREPDICMALFYPKTGWLRHTVNCVTASNLPTNFPDTGKECFC